MNYLYKAGVYLYALTLAVFGTQHFMYAGYVSTTVPHWIPWHLFWTYLVGTALIAVAISLVIDKQARLACTLLGLMIFALILLVDIPAVLSNIHDGGTITSTFKDVGLGCCALILAYTFKNNYMIV